MNNTQLEQWAIKILGVIESGGGTEDDRVELKGIWPNNIERAARQIAGHANASRGEDMLWIIGVDEKKGVVGIDFEELSTWWAQIKSNFVDNPPTLRNLNLYHDSKSIAVLLFDTSRPPYLVKNPSYSNKKGPIEHEVPWREANGTRTATRFDLLRILSPITSMPKYEIFSGKLKLNYNPEEEESVKYAWSLELNCYIEPENDNRITIPFHRSKASVDVSKIPNPITFDGLTITLPYSVEFDVGDWSKYSSPLASETPSEIHIWGPCIVSIQKFKLTSAFDIDTFVDALIEINLPISNIGSSLRLSSRLSLDSVQDLEDGSWVREWNSDLYEHVIKIVNH